MTPTPQEGSPFQALVVALVLIVVSLPTLARQANRQRDGGLFLLLLVALLVKLMGSIAHFYFAFDLEGSGVDANRYHSIGALASQLFHSGEFSAGLTLIADQGGSEGTRFIFYLTSAVYSLTGPNALAGFIVFSWLGFWGLFFFYRAFVIAAPEGRSQTYALLVFFLPSMIFWPSSIGKEAWMLFALGMAVYGCARLMTRVYAPGLLFSGIGLFLASLIRIHLAAILGLAIVAAYAIKRSSPRLGHLAPVFKGVALLALMGVGGLLAVQTGQFLRENYVNEELGFSQALVETSERTGQGGSAFTPVVVDSPLKAPQALVTVLFRPFPTEAGNIPAYMASFEGLFLMGLVIFRWRWIAASMTRMRRQPLIGLALVFIALFTIAFSSFGNFGLLARQRTQVLPMVLILAAIPPPRRLAPATLTPALQESAPRFATA